MITASGSIRLTAEAMPVAERLDRAVDQLLGEVVAVVERALPDAAGQRGLLVLLHQLEEVGLVRPLRAAGAPRLPSPSGPRRPPCSPCARRGTWRRRA